jgi:hypothetical protein
MNLSLVTNVVIVKWTMRIATCLQIRLKNFNYWMIRSVDVLQVEIHTARPLVFGVEISLAKVEKYKWRGGDQIPAELVQGGGEILLSEIHKFINSIRNKEEIPDQSKRSIIVPIYKNGDKTYCSNYYEYHCYHLHTLFYLISLSQN